METRGPAACVPTDEMKPGDGNLLLDKWLIRLTDRTYLEGS